MTLFLQNPAETFSGHVRVQNKTARAKIIRCDCRQLTKLPISPKGFEQTISFEGAISQIIGKMLPII